MNKIRKSIVLTVIFTFLISMFTNVSVQAAPDFDVKTEITLNEENKEATIKIDIKDIDPSYTIQNITNPDLTMMDMENQESYIVKENGIYNFTIKYFDSNEQEIKEFIKEVTVDVFKDEKEEERVGLSLPNKTPRATTSDNGDSLNVQFNRTGGTPIDWTDVSTVDWTFYNTEQIEINATFSGIGDEKTRTIEIDIPDGYQILAYAAKNGTNSVAGEQIISTTSVVEQAMMSSEISSQDGNTYGSQTINKYTSIGYVSNGVLGKPLTYQMRSGKVSYTFNTTADNITLTLQVGIDKALYDYSDTRERFSDILGGTSLGISTGQLLDDLSVTMTSGTEILEEKVKANVKGTMLSMYLNGGGNPTYIEDDGYSPTIYPYGKSSLYIAYPTGSDGRGFIEEVVLTFNYPDGAIYQGLDYVTTAIPPENVTVNNNESTKTLTLTIKNITQTGAITYPYPMFKLDGDIYGVFGSGKITAAVFGGKMAVKMHETESYMLYTFPAMRTNIVEKNIPVEVVGYNSKSYDFYGNGYTDLDNDGKQDGYQFLGNFAVTNPAAVEQTDLPLEWTFSDDLGIKIVRFGIASTSSVDDIMVYTNKNAEGYSIVPSSISNKIILDGDKIGLDDDEYIEKVTGTISSIAAYTTTGNIYASKINGFAAYGIYKNGTGGTQTLTVNNVTTTINVETTTEKINNTSGTALMKSLDTTYYPGTSIPIKMRYTGGSGSYNRTKQLTTEFLQDPNIYIRVPEGFSLDETSLELLFDNKDVTSKATLKSMTTKDDGAIVYKYSFDDPYTVMAGYQMKGGTGSYNTPKYFNVNFNLKVNASNQGYANLVLRDIIMLEVENDFVSYDGNGTYIREDDFGVTDSGNNLLVPLETVKTNIVKLPELQVDSGIRIKDSGNEYYTYDGTNSTIASLSRDYSAEVEISYYNNAPNNFTEANIYIPIPKAGRDYGKYFNNKTIIDPANNYNASPFTWTANLTDEVSALGFTTYYAVDGNVNTTDYSGGTTWEPFIPTTQWYTYSQLLSAGKTLNDVIFLKFENQNPIESKDEGSFTFELQADIDSPVDVENYWRTYTGAKAEGATNNSWVYGSVLAGTLSVGKIGGQVFIDCNGNGIYDASTDEIFTGSEITVNLTEKDGKISTTTLPIDPVTGTFNIEMLKEGEYSISAINSANTTYHFTKSTDIADTEVKSNAVFNAAHTQGKVENLVINALTSAEITNIGIGLIENTPATFLFESNVVGDSELTGVSMTLNSSTIDHTGNIPYSQFYYLEKYGLEPTVIVPTGYTHVGWNIYINGVKQGTTIEKGNLSTSDILLANAGSSYEIKAVIGYPPIVTTNTLNVFEGDIVDLLSGLSATTANGEEIQLNAIAGALQNTTITIPDNMISDSKYSTLGTYQVSYTVTDVTTGAYSVVTRNIKVNGLPTITANPQEYVIENNDIVDGVINNPTASWKKASDTVGTQPVDTTISGPAVTTPSNDT
ncbi:MAG: SdrD B-like domain-containing protein, partial [Coprobacillaceae bacterium]